MSLDGSWNVTMNTPMGAQQGVLALTTNGGELTGTMTGAQGALTLTDGKASGNEGSWKAALTQPMPITLEFSVKVDGDSMSGNVKLGMFGSAPLTGSRA